MSQNFCKKHQLQQIAVCINSECDQKGNLCMRCLKEKHQNHLADCIDLECYQKITELQTLQSEIIHWKNQFNSIIDMIVSQLAFFLEQTNKFDSAIVKFKKFEIPNIIEQIKSQKNEQLEIIQQLKEQLQNELKDSVQDSGMTQKSQYMKTEKFRTDTLEKTQKISLEQVENEVKENFQENQFQQRTSNKNPLLVYTELQCQRCQEYFTKCTNKALPDGYCEMCAQQFLKPHDQIPRLKQMSQISEGPTQSRLSKTTQRQEQSQKFGKSSQDLIQEKVTSSTLLEEQQDQESTSQVKCDVCKQRNLISDLYVNMVCLHKTCFTCINQVHNDKLTTKCLVFECTQDIDRQNLNEYYNEYMSIKSEY